MTSDSPPPSGNRAHVLVERRVAGACLRAHCEVHNRVRAGSALQAFAGAADDDGLRAGATIRFGWSLLRLFAVAEDALEAREPDFAAWPAEGWSPTIDITLDVLASQVTMLRQTGAEPLDATFDQYLVTIPSALAEPAVFMRRDPPQGPDDSGWTLAPLSDPDVLTTAPDQAHPVTLASVAVRRPAAAAVMTLPRGYIAVIEDDYITLVYDETGQERLSTPERIGTSHDDG